MEYLDILIDKLINDSNFPLIPHLKNINESDRFIFNFFRNLNNDIIISGLFKYTNDIRKIETSFKVINAYKGISDISTNIQYISFEIFKSILPFINTESINILSNKFYKELLLDDNTIVDVNTLLNFCIDEDFELFLKYAKQNNLDVIHTIFKHQPDKVFVWINNHTSKYEELIKLNEPQFILSNMNGKLDVNEDSLKYFFEICPLDIPLFKELKKTIGFKTIFKYTKNKLHYDVFIEIIDTLDEIIFLLNDENIPISIIEKILNSVKTKYPHIYENFNSLMFMKKNFINK